MAASLGGGDAGGEGIEDLRLTTRTSHQYYTEGFERQPSIAAPLCREAQASLETDGEKNSNLSSMRKILKRKRHV